jgi:hypothetical protein
MKNQKIDLYSLHSQCNVYSYEYAYICLYLQIYNPFRYLLLYLVNKNNKVNSKENKEITRTWLAGQSSCTLIIPKDFAKQYGLDKPSHIIIEGQQDGILIKKLELSANNET